jgi:hypothetical protein
MGEFPRETRGGFTGAKTYAFVLKTYGILLARTGNIMIKLVYFRLYAWSAV